MVIKSEKSLVCEHCGAEADMVIEGFESVQDVIKKMKKEKKKVVCKSCGKEIEAGKIHREPAACEHCGAEADMTLEGFEKVAGCDQEKQEDVLQPPAAKIFHGPSGRISKRSRSPCRQRGRLHSSIPRPPR